MNRVCARWVGAVLVLVLVWAPGFGCDDEIAEEVKTAFAESVEAYHARDAERVLARMSSMDVEYFERIARVVREGTREEALQLSPTELSFFFSARNRMPV